MEANPAFGQILCHYLDQVKVNLSTIIFKKYLILKEPILDQLISIVLFCSNVQDQNVDKHNAQNHFNSNFVNFGCN
ncbi:hypothetical protein V1477_017864 [Vespula maculifrons]|uniref:Uncharacterized protein n=1 Tax=Vespula maculifrons TaxID=7453 RepID=A0ABD2B1B5_VESMC